MKKYVYILTVVLLVLVFGVSAFFVGSYIIESREQAEKNAALAALKDSVKETAPVQTEPEETEPEATFSEAEIRNEDGMLVEYAEIYAQNPDLVGWIRIDGTPLNNPVMQTPDRPNFYLDHDFDGNSSEWGAIYAREECDINAPSDNITLYGHNMLDGSMFSVVHDYIDRQTWENNPLIFFDTLNEYHVYKIFAVFKTSANLGEGYAYHQFNDAANEEEFNEFVRTVKNMSFYNTGVDAQYGDMLITLSTCEYTLDNGRLVVVAKRIS